MRKITRYLLLFITLLFLFQFIIQPVLADKEITFDFYYPSTCGSCNSKRLKIYDPIKEMFENESDIIEFTAKDFSINDTYKSEYNEYMQNYSLSFPFIIIENSTNMTIIKSTNIKIHSQGDIEESIAFISQTLQAFIAEAKINESLDDNILELDFLIWQIKVNVSDLSLPIFTIVLGVADSLNPCAFFILVILLSLLIHAQSRKRMLLIGGIFIFFSGFLYAIFMFVLFNVFVLTKEIMFITIIAGCIAIVLGCLDIKDFFFFKKGASLSIPEDKKPGLYKQMRNLVKNPRIAAVVAGTIVLAGTVNFYELLCTLGLPLVFTQKLSTYNLPAFDYYMYIFFYNVVYVTPLIIIVLIFVFSLGRFKLTEWHGQILKLFAGTMLTSLGVILLIDYQILENLVTPILLLGFGALFTFVVSRIWKKKFIEENLE